MRTLRGEWIWHGEDPAPYHHFLRIRRVVPLGPGVRAATLRITATDRYRLWVDGAFLGRGPVRGDAAHQTYDTYDLGPRPGKEHLTVAVLAYHYGCPTAYTRDARAGVLAEIEVERGGGPPVLIGTDAAWRASPSLAWRRDARAAGIGVGVTEVCDARRDDPDWREPGYDDGAWEPAVVIPAQAGPWARRLEPRPIPMLVERVVAPVRITGTGEILQLEDSAAAVDIAEVLARDPVLPARAAVVEGADALLSPGADGAGAVFRVTPHAAGGPVSGGVCAPFVVLDFGRQVNAFIRLHVTGPAGAVVDLSYTEELVNGRVVPLMNSTRCADRYILREGEQHWESFEYHSFRYLQVTVRDAAHPVRIHAVTGNTWSYPAVVRGAFRSSDPTLTSLWDACVRTTDLCTDDAFMDTPFREKRNWTGDGSHAVLGALATWGDTPVVRRYFQLTLHGVLGNGMPRIFYPGTDLLEEKTRLPITIPQHALVYAARVREHYRYFGDPALLDQQYPLLRGLAGWCARHADPRGLLSSLPYWNWLDWTPADLRGANLGTNAFYLGLLDDLAAIAGVVDPGAADAYARDAALLRSTIRETFWDADRGRFADSHWRGRLTGIASQLGNALTLLYGIARPGDIPSVVESILSDPGLAPSTPLFFHYVIQGLIAVGRHEAALAQLRARFGPMMESGDTVREGWTRFALMPQLTESTPGVPDLIPDGDYRAVFPTCRPGTSAAAHCGGVGVGFLLLTGLLGIEPRGPGFREGCVLRPRPDLLERADGSFPSPRGDIRVRWTPSELVVELPEGMTGVLWLPGRDQSRRLESGATATPLHT